MKLEIGDLLGRQMPLALLFAILVQGGGAVWWMAERERDHAYVERRVMVLETAQARMADAQGRMLERMARMEAQMEGAVKSLDRIERQVARK